MHPLIPSRHSEGYGRYKSKKQPEEKGTTKRKESQQPEEAGDIRAAFSQKEIASERFGAPGT
ncbi:MAG: hypothetical protein WCQ16_11035 [Verrucomicrobiae bacterium]